MPNINDELWKGTPRQTIITFLGDNHTPITSGIHSGSMSLTRALAEESNQLEFGGCVSAQFKATIEINENLVGKRIKVSQNVGEYSMNLFTGTIASCIKTSSDGTSREITAYDDFYYLGDRDVSEWYNNLNWDAGFTFAEMERSLLNYVGITGDAGVFYDNETHPVKYPNMNSISFRNMLRQICQIDCAFGIINEDGTFTHKHFPFGMHPYSYNVQSNMESENYEVKTISCVKLINDSAMGTYEDTYADDYNPYIVKDNVLLYGKTKDELDAMADLCATGCIDLAISYKPFRANLKISNPNLVGITHWTKWNAVSDSETIPQVFPFATRLYGVQLMEQEVWSWGDEYRDASVDNSTYGGGGNVEPETNAPVNLLIYPYNQTTKSANNCTITDNGDGTITIDTSSPVSTATSFTLFDTRNTTQPMLCEGGKTYTLSWNLSGARSGLYLATQFYDANKSYIAGSRRYVYEDTGSNTVTLPSNASYMICYLTVPVNYNASNVLIKPMLEEGTTAHAYQPFVNEGLVYCQAERKIGRWLDGQVMYEKTFIITLDSTTGLRTVSLPLTDGATQMVDIHQVVKFSSGSLSNLPYINTTYTPGDIRTETTQIVGDSPSISVYTGMSRNGTKIYLTVRYVK